MFDKLGRQARSAATPLDAAKANKMAESVANTIGIFIVRHPSCWAPFNLLSNRHQGHNGLLHPDEGRCAPLALISAPLMALLAFPKGGPLRPK